MPLPMVHLGIAIQLGTMKDKPPSAAFLLGSIAPDSIHMRPGWDRAAKYKSHLAHDDEGGEARMREFLTVQAGSEPHRQTFAAGYIAHVLTDNLWLQTAAKEFRNQIPPSLDAIGRRKLYYEEADQVDFNLYNEASWREDVWGKLRQAKAVDLSPLLTAEEIQLWQDRTLRWFDELKEEPKIEPQYLTDSFVKSFMEIAAIYVAEKLDDWCIYHYG